MRKLQLAAAACALATPALAAPITFSAILRGELGYATNPELVDGVSGGSGYGALSFAPVLTSTTARSVTQLSGNFRREGYFRRFKHIDTASGDLNRTDQLTEHLQNTFDANYTWTNNQTVLDVVNPVVVNTANVGQHTSSVFVSDNLQWQASARDTIGLGGNFAHVSTKGDRYVVTDTYRQYGGTASYSHALDARTSVGAEVTVSKTVSRIYPDSRAIQPALTAKRQLNAEWVLSGHLGVILQKSDGPYGGHDTSVGYGAQLCGTYPRLTFCAAVDRGQEPSLYGGARTQTSITANLKYDLTEHSRVTLAGFYSDSDASEHLPSGLIDSVTAVEVSGDYDRDLTRRLSAGFGARYRLRDSSVEHPAHSIAGMIHLSAKLGRL